MGWRFARGRHGERGTDLGHGAEGAGDQQQSNHKAFHGFQLTTEMGPVRSIFGLLRPDLQ